MTAPAASSQSSIAADNPSPQQATVNVEELIYTSAPKLLNSNVSHLGVVARTKAFPAEIETAVSKQWAYSMPTALGLPESQTLPRFYLLPVAVQQQQWTSLSRVQSAGFDHTGRTNPIAHHFAVDRRLLENCGGAVESLVSWASRHYVTEAERVFCDHWDDEPKELRAREIAVRGRRSPSALLQSIPEASGLTPEDIQRAWCAAIETLLAYPASQKMAVVVIRPAFAPYVLSFVAAVLASLPKTIQSAITATSHVWELSDAPANYWLTFTYPRSPYFERINERADVRKPVIIDIALKVPAIPATNGEYVSFLQTDCAGWGIADLIPLPRLFDEVDPAAKYAAGVYLVKRAMDAWTQNPSYFTFSALVESANQAVKTGLPPAGVGQLVDRNGFATIDKLIASADWNSAFEIALAATVPASVRERAWEAIRTHFVRIAAVEPALVAQRTLQQGSDRLIGLLSEYEQTIDVVLGEAESRTRGLSSQDSHAVATRWAALGTKILGRIWKRISADLASGVSPSPFYRRVLDKVIPVAVVPQDDAAASRGTDRNQQPVFGLEALLRPAWAIVSRQIRSASAADPLCMVVLDRLVSVAVVPTSGGSPATPSATTPRRDPFERASVVTGSKDG